MEPQLTELFASAAGIAVLAAMVTGLVRTQWPQISGSGAVLMTWLLAPLLAVGGYALGLTPDGTTWQMAVALGLNAALIANGGYSALKVLNKDRETRRAELAHRPRPQRRPGDAPNHPYA